MLSNIIQTPTLDFYHNVKICRPMYNTHPHISTQDLKTRGSISVKTAILLHNTWRRRRPAVRQTTTRWLVA